MPIYEYKCWECGHMETHLQRYNDVTVMECPACKEVALQRQISAPAFDLKGDGWYDPGMK